MYIILKSNIYSKIVFVQIMIIYQYVCMEYEYWARSILKVQVHSHIK